jgi:hypothetical protein
LGEAAAGRFGSVEPMTRNPRWATAALLTVLVSALPAGIVTGAPQPPRLTTNESYVEDVGRVGDFDIADPTATFAFVLNALPERVKVYPTENYYYFAFHHRGVRYVGNIRLENETRDQGKVHFAYEVEAATWNRPEKIFHVLLDGSHGLAVEKLDPLVYRLTYRGKSVTFELNDLSKVAPPPTAIAPGERYIGPVFDESAVRFFLVYNPKLRVFHYVLDETVPVADELVASLNDRILIGKRTGFAFYRDHKRERKILIGVFEGNVRVNNYFDGPFDQLPDNFIEGETLRSAILEVEPRLAGRIDRFGSSFDRQMRYAISPYMQYVAVRDLQSFHRCAVSRRGSSDRYYACFVVDEQTGRPMATHAQPRRRTPAVKRSGPSGHVRGPR